MNIAKRIKFFRLYHHLSQKELAEKVGYSFQGISLIEDGKRKVPSEKLCAFALALKIKPSDLLEDNWLIREFQQVLKPTSPLGKKDERGEKA